MSVITIQCIETKGDPRPHPFPGTPMARLQGCKCPQIQPVRGSFQIELDCPVHRVNTVSKKL
jgi:hypothetical protein